MEKGTAQHSDAKLIQYQEQLDEMVIQFGILSIRQLELDKMKAEAKIEYENRLQSLIKYKLENGIE